MKVCAKSLLIAMLFPVAGSALAWEDSFYATKEITFEVDIQGKACDIAAGLPPVNVNGRGSMDLRSVARTPDSKGLLLPIKFVFSNCSSVSHVQSIEFKRDVGTTNISSDKLGGPDKGFVATTMDNVKIKLYSDDSASSNFKKKTFNPELEIKEGQPLTVCYARAEVDRNGASPGPFKGAAEFLVTYR